MHVEVGKGKQGKIEYFKMELEEGEKELIPYCEDIKQKCDKIANESNENRDKEYSYPL